MRDEYLEYLIEEANKAQVEYLKACIRLEELRILEPWFWLLMACLVTLAIGAHFS